MNHLPKGWASTTVASLIELNPKTDATDEALAGFSPMPLLGTRYRDLVGFELRRWGDIRKSYVHFQDGDVLLAKITPCFENGKAGLVRGMPSGIGAGSSEYLVCRPYPEALDPRYLLALFKTDEFLKAGETRMTGSVGHKRVPKDYLLETALSLAPRAEQSRIVDKLDALFARVESCSERLYRVPILVKRFRQSVLEAALVGDLSEEWREFASDSAKSWRDTTLDEIADVGTGSTPLRSNGDFYADSGTPWVTSSATGSHFVDGAAEFVTPAAIAAHRLKVYPPGTLLVAMYGEGKTRGQVTELRIHATVNQACAAIRVDESQALKAFVKLALWAQYEAMRAMAEGGNQPNLNLTKIKGITIRLPCKNEQAEIVRRVESLFALADAIEAKCKSARAQVERLTPAILAKAFRGELVPQDPNDEPASDLLVRLQAERAAAPARKTRARKAAGDAA